MKHNLTEMKHDYQNIPIPPELKTRVEQSIFRAKKDNEQAADVSSPARQKWSGPSKFRRFALGGAGGVAAAVLTIAVLANSSASIAHAMEEIPIIGTIARVVTFRQYQHKEHNMQADLKIPEIQVENKEGNVLPDATKDLNDAIQKYTDQIIAAYESDVKAAGGEGIEDLTLDYDIVTDNDKLFSLRFQQCIVMAGAAQSQKIYHIDKTTGKMITLEDLFADQADYQTVISENIKTQMKQQMAEDETKVYWLDSDVPEWNFQEISADVNFYINESGKLTIVFDEYQVAPGSMGIVSFEIPTEILKDIVKDGYLN
ncbi:MAG: DUF3298 and DUF4163 domain-containing protein [Lachnospiraceae bacterium]|nr:DUF3298 and DUF4163 domain-containing protein [Lachnospiraceae bacterium]